VLRMSGAFSLPTVQSRSVANCAAPSASLVGLGLNGRSKLFITDIEILEFVAAANDLTMTAARARREPAHHCSYLWSGLHTRSLFPTRIASTTKLTYGNLTAVILKVRNRGPQQGIRSAESEGWRGELVS
jgi:hypothetical protein